MAVTAFPFDDQDTSESQFSQWARELQDSGVADRYGGLALRVTGGGGGMAVQIQAGMALIRGHALISTAVETRTITAAPSSGTRTDLVVARINPATNAGELAVLTGTAGSSAPAVTQTDTGIYEIALAQVTVQANATTIDAAMVLDARRYLGTTVGVWSTATRPPNPRTAKLGFNKTTSRWEFFNGNTWQDFASGTAENSSQWSGYELIVSPTQPSITPLPNRIWIQPTP